MAAQLKKILSVIEQCICEIKMSLNHAVFPAKHTHAGQDCSCTKVIRAVDWLLGLLAKDTTC
jgi:hypothetical protein